jgi:hypothetical protein
VTLEDFIGNVTKRLPHVTRFLLDPIATPIFTEPAPGSCVSGWDAGTGAAKDAEIPWDVTIPHLPGWSISEKVFKFNADGSVTELTNFTWNYNPTRLVIPRGDHNLPSATDCVDVMVVISQTNSVGKRKVAGLVQFQICGDCTQTVAVPMKKKA